MSRLFNDAASQYMYRSGCPKNRVPLTFSCMVYPDDLANTGAIITQQNSSNPYYMQMLSLIPSGGRLYARMYHGENGSPSYVGAPTSSNYIGAANGWHHLGAVFAATNNRTVYLDGTGTNDTSTLGGAEAGAQDVLEFGRQYNGGSPTWYFSGRICEVGIWNVALDAGEMLALARGYAPWFIRPSELLAYWPVLGNDSPEFDRGPDNLYPMTLGAGGQAPSKARHAPMIYPVGHQIGQAGA